MTLFGTSAKYIDSVHKAGLKPRETHDLSSVRTMTSTGSPRAGQLRPRLRGVKSDVHLASISRGTDIVGCFVLGNPMLPVRRGEIQARGSAWLSTPSTRGRGRCGARRASWSARRRSRRCRWASGTILTAGLPRGVLRPLPGVWRHGDDAEITEHGGVIIYGRSDATLNPGGVRIGTAEIYRQVESGRGAASSDRRRPGWEGDVRVVLFVVLKSGLRLDDALSKKIKAEIRANCTPRHVPARIVQVDDIPRTKSGKITELAVRDVVHGRPIKNIELLANPDSLAAFKEVEALKS